MFKAMNSEMKLKVIKWTQDDFFGYHIICMVFWILNFLFCLWQVQVII